MKAFYISGLIIAVTIPQPALALSKGQACVNAAAHQFSVINLNFDGSCNQMHHMVMSTGNPNNKNYTFREMLKQDNTADFIKAMQKETQDHESWGHWEIIK